MIVWLLVWETRAASHWWEGEGVQPSPTPTFAVTLLPPATPVPSATAAPHCVIEILDREPTAPFDLVGLVEVQERSPVRNSDGVVESAKAQACSLGGDALVILHRSEPRRSGIERRRSPRGVLPDPALRAAVIRYRRP